MRRVLLDQGVPNGVRKFLPTYLVETAYQRGWSTLTNGRLLSAAEAAGFDVLVTADQNLRYQQNLSERAIGIVVLETNLWPIIAIDPQIVVSAVDAALPGQVMHVPYPKPPKLPFSTVT